MVETKLNRTSQRKIIHQQDRIESLKKLLVYYKEITETVREPFIILDSKLCVVTANVAFYRKFKVGKRDTERKLIYKLGNNQWDAPELRELLEHILPKHRVFSNFEVTHNFPLLGRKTMLLNARQVDSKQLILVAIEDITELKKLKINSDKMTASLVRQRDKLQGLSDAKDEFINMASHQLRTPATAVKQYVGMLTSGYVGKLTKKQMDMLDIAYESNQRQLEIIEDLLRVARVDDGKVYLEKSACNVVEQVEIAIKSQASLFNSRRQNVVLNKPKYKVIALIDQKLMLMVLENLLDNAGKYSADDEQITINVRQNDDNTLVSFKDNGVGILEKDHHKLFKRFSRIDNSLTESVSGTGLGLYWAKKILDLHEGSIEVTSNLHTGTTFTVKMPMLAIPPTNRTSATRKTTAGNLAAR